MVTVTDPNTYLHVSAPVLQLTKNLCHPKITNSRNKNYTGLDGGKEGTAGSSRQCTRGENIPPIQRAGGQRSLVEMTLGKTVLLSLSQEGAS